VTVTVDGLGAYGWGTGAGDAIFNPPVPSAGALGTTHSSNLYLSTAGRMLADDCGSGQVQVLSESPLTTRLTIGALQIDLTQQLDPVTLGHSTLRQTYTLTNTSGSDVPVTLVRHVDGDLRYSNPGGQDGAAASGTDGRSLTEFDSVSTTSPRAFLTLQ